MCYASNFFSECWCDIVAWVCIQMRLSSEFRRELRHMMDTLIVLFEAKWQNAKSEIHTQLELSECGAPFNKITTKCIWNIDTVRYTANADRAIHDRNFVNILVCVEAGECWYTSTNHIRTH